MSHRAHSPDSQAQYRGFTALLLPVIGVLVITLVLMTGAALWIGQVTRAELIAYKSGTNATILYLVDVNRRIAQPIYQDALAYETWLAWSPNGERLAFVAQTATSSEIYVMNIDGTDRINVTNDPARESFPAWLDDQRLIYWTLREAGYRRVYVVDVITGEAQPYTDRMVPNADSRYSWTHDGLRYALVTWRHGQEEIYVRDIRESQSIRLTDDPALDYNPVFSPDGQRIAFWSNRENGDMRLYVMNADGSNVTPVTPPYPSQHEYSWSVTWSADGAKLAFIGFLDGGLGMYTVNANGGAITRIITLDSAPGDPPPILAWRPD